MGHSKVTLIGLESYLNPDHSVFESAEFPEGINKETLMGAIFLRCQEFELLYSDPDFMIAAVNIWARKHYWTFDKWVKLLSKEYDPLYNKDYYDNTLVQQVDDVVTEYDNKAQSVFGVKKDVNVLWNRAQNIYKEAMAYYEANNY